MSAETGAKKLKIVFMGTPDFAVPSLEALVSGGYRVIAVITQPDRPKGRGRREAPSPVKEAADRHSIPVLQPERVRDEESLREFLSLGADLVALVAFGQILPKRMLESPKYGIVNVHPSLLPKYRGAAPINWALMRGETETGVTTIRLGEGVDSGDILLQEKAPIFPEENYGELSERLAAIGARLLVETIEGLVEGKIDLKPQDHDRATLAPRLTKEDGHVNWGSNPQTVVNLIRGLSPVPGAYSILQGKQLKIFAAQAGSGRPEEKPGTVKELAGEALAVAAADGYVLVREVQMEGKKRMGAKEFARGRGIIGEVLS